MLRQELVDLLTKGQAHVTVAQALERLPPELCGRRPAPEVPSVFEQLEHMRLAQEDILRYTLDPAWQSPPWPEGYWPSRGHVPTPAEWRDAVARFKSDLAGVVALAQDSRRALTRRLPHGEGRTYLRQVLLVADHNAYHLGQLVQVLRLLRAWPD